MSESLVARIPDGMVIKVDGRVKVRPGRKFKRSVKFFGIAKHKIVAISRVKGSSSGIVQAIPQGSQNGPYALLHVDEAEFFRRIIQQVFNEMPVSAA